MRVCFELFRVKFCRVLYIITIVRCARGYYNKFCVIVDWDEMFLYKSISIL